MSSVSMKDTYEVIYDLSVYLMKFDIGCHLKVKSRSHNFKSFYLINNAFYDQGFMKYIMTTRYMQWIYNVLYDNNYFVKNIECETTSHCLKLH